MKKSLVMFIMVLSLASIAKDPVNQSSWREGESKSLMQAFTEVTVRTNGKSEGAEQEKKFQKTRIEISGEAARNIVENHPKRSGRAFEREGVSTILCRHKRDEEYSCRITFDDSL